MSDSPVTDSAPSEELKKGPRDGAGFDKEHRKKANKGALLSVVGGVFLAAVRAMGFLLRAVFGGEAWGLYAIAWASIELLSFLLLGGFSDAVVIFSSRLKHAQEKDGGASPEETEEHYRAMATILKVPLLTALGLATLVHFSAPHLHALLWSEQDPKLVPLLQALAWALPLLVLVQIPAEATRASLSFGYAIGIVQITFPVLSVLCALGLYYTTTPDILAVALGTLVALVLCVPLSLYAYSRHFELRRTVRASFSSLVHREALSFALPQSINMMLNQGLVRLDSLMLSFFGVSANAIGVYSLVGDLTQVIRLTKMAYSGVYSPLVAKFRAAGNHLGVEQALESITRKTSSLGMAVFLGLMSVWPLLIFQQSESWDEPVLFAWLLSAGPMMSCFFGLCGNTLLMYGHSRLLLTNALVSGGINVVLNALLIPPFGLMGAALATAVSNIFISCLQVVELRRLEGIAPHPHFYTRTLASSVPALILVLLFSGMLWPATGPLPGISFSVGQVVPRILLAACAVFLYALLQWTLPGVRPFGYRRPRKQVRGPKVA